MKIREGETAAYIQDYNFKRMFEIPKEVALAWVQAKCPETQMGNGIKASELVLEEMEYKWLNKLFIIIEIRDRDLQYAITNWDGRFVLYEGKVDDV